MVARIIMTPGYELRAKLAAAGPVHNVAQDIADDIRGNIRAGGHVVTMALLRSVRARRRSNGDSYVSIGTDHWTHIEYGTAPHVIIAPPGQVLTFVKPNGERVFTTKINHPGNRPYRVVRRAVYKKRGLRGG
jgi:hypothetical protein